MTLTDDAILARAESVMHADLEDAIAMMNIETGEYYNLNPVGSRIWTLLVTPHSVGAICDVLVQEFDVPRQTCRDETACFLADLLDRQIVRQV
jgi:Coenzyme PQQ synthesis protein D (PqqD)